MPALLRSMGHWCPVCCRSFGHSAGCPEETDQEAEQTNPDEE